MKQFTFVVTVPRFLCWLHLPTLPTWELLAAYAGDTVTNPYNTGGVCSRNSRAAPNMETTWTCVQFPWLQKSLLIFQGRVSTWRKEEKAYKPSLAAASWELAKLPLGSGGKGTAFGSSDFSAHLVASSLSRLDMCTSAPQTPRSAISQDTSEKAPVQSLLWQLLLIFLHPPPHTSYRNRTRETFSSCFQSFK